MIKFDTYDAMLDMCKDLDITPFPPAYKGVIQKKDLKRIMYFKILDSAKGPFSETHSYIFVVGDRLGLKPKSGYSNSVFDSAMRIMSTLVDKDFV